MFFMRLLSHISWLENEVTVINVEEMSVPTAMLY